MRKFRRQRDGGGKAGDFALFACYLILFCSNAGMNLNATMPAPESATDEPGSSPQPQAPAEFDPVALRYRQDGLTPQKQREYVEALADTGLACAAAARIGVSVQSVNRLQRRADAGSFNLACAAARRHGARRLHAIAWERAIEGTIKRHYYHGELKAEERVYNDRLLTYLLGKTEHLLDEPEEARAVARNWQPWVEALEAGAPPPDLYAAPPGPPRPELTPEEELAAELTGDEVWQEDGVWWTSFPPPAGFDGWEIEVFGMEGYRRQLSPAELEVAEAGEQEEDEEEVSHAVALRDLHFGFAGGRADYAAAKESARKREGEVALRAFFASRQAEASETSGPFAGNPGEDSAAWAGIEEAP